MKYSQEFFTQRSFEVVWAVFRVGEFVSRKELRELLEQKALGYLSTKAVDNLAELEEVIKLAIQIGEIKDVNGRVLLRETGVLREALLEREQSVAVQKDLSERQIEEIFEQRKIGIGSMDTDEQEESGKELPNSAMMQDSPAMKRDEAKAKEGIETHSNDKRIYGKTPTQGNASEPITGSNRNAIESGNVLPESLKGTYTSYERKAIILDLLKKRNMCGMRDVVAALPDVSERTLRYDIQGLVERKLVERIGKGGPDSFLRLRATA